MRAWFQIRTAGRAYAWLLFFGVTRTIIDYIWIIPHATLPYRILVLFSYTLYQFTLYLLIPAIAGLLLERVLSRPVDASAVLRESVLVWIVYPAVGVISLVLKSPPTQKIEWFRYIPAFMVENNFLPVGMIAVIPVLIIFYTRLFMRHSSAHWPRAFAAVLIALLIFYVVYYQYTARLFLHLLLGYSWILAFGYYNLVFLIPLFPLVNRFHRAFGPHRVTLLGLLLAWAIPSLGLVFAGLPSLFPARGQATRPPAAVEPFVDWSLRRFQLYDQVGEMAAYGYYLDMSSAGGPVRIFQLLQPQSFFFPNLEYVTSDPKSLSYEGLLDIRIGPSILTFDWNRNGTHGNPVMESFRGTDSIAACTASLHGQELSCFMLDETLSTDVAQPMSWQSETFIAVSGTDVTVIAFAVGGYSDGIIAIRDRRHTVTQVTRQDSEVTIEFEGGTLVADCTRLAEYETMRVVEPQPVDSPVRCQVVIRPDRDPEITTTVDGLLERIGDAQGMN